MIRRTVRIQLVAFVLITAVGILYLGFGLIGIDAIRPPFVVRAQFASSGGIFTNAEVNYRGVGVGRVGELKLLADGVEVELKIKRDKKIPSDTVAVVANKSAVGEQFVDLQPRTRTGPFLRNGSIIKQADTRVPIEIQTVAVDFDRLIRGIDTKKLQILINGLGDAFADTGPALQRLLDSGAQLTDAFQSVLPETLRLIRDGRTVLETARETSSHLRDFASGLADLSESLRVADPSVRRLLDNGVAASRELNAVLSPSATALSTLLGNLVTLNDLNVVRLGGLRQVLQSLPTVVEQGPLALVDGILHNGLVTDPVQMACEYDVPRRLPRDYSPREPWLDAHCPPGTSGERGAEHAPHPGDGGSGSSGQQTSDSRVGSRAASPAAVWAARQRQLVGDETWLMLLYALVH